MCEWINVKDRLPEDGQQVWTYFLPDKDMYFAIYQDGKWWDFRNDESKGCEYTVKVTHWMPLPTPPKG